MSILIVSLVASVAQLVVQLIRNQQVTGSSPVTSSISVVRKGCRQSKPQDTESFLWFFAVYCVFRALAVAESII